MMKKYRRRTEEEGPLGGESRGLTESWSTGPVEGFINELSLSSRVKAMAGQTSTLLVESESFGSMKTASEA
jgi:hypothetical protein